MILIISTCKHKLHENEFVIPIQNILSNQNIKFETIHYNSLENLNFDPYKKIIICGTALKDNKYLEHLDKFEFLKNLGIPVLGICSGMQILGLINDAKLEKIKEIGMTKISILHENKLFKTDLNAYTLHGNSLINLDEFEIIAKSDSCTQAIKLKNKEQYGILFHPEVRNEQIIIKFIS
jgi:GMP synthase-like glutamine amidotransferase